MSWPTLALLLIFCLAIQAFFTMAEMACVSFNKVRLAYYVNQNNSRAKSVHQMVTHPTLLFGTTMLGANAFMLIGSECGRRCYHALGLDPAWAPLTQVLLVVIFAELGPMIAGRRYAEHAAMLAIPLLSGFSWLVRPIIWLFHGVSSLVYRLMRAPREITLALTRDELQNAIEEGEETDTIVANIFSLKNKIADDVMVPMTRVSSVATGCTIAEMRDRLASLNLSFLLIFHHTLAQIVAIAYPRDLLRATDDMKVNDVAKPPWFIAQSASIIDILQQFRKNNQTVAVVLDAQGQAVGVLTLDAIIDEIFAEWENLPHCDGGTLSSQRMIDRTLPGETSLAHLKERYHIDFKRDDASTLEELCRQLLGHAPSQGDELRIENYILTIQEAPLIGSLEISIQSIDLLHN